MIKIVYTSNVGDGKIRFIINIKNAVKLYIYMCVS